MSTPPELSELQKSSDPRVAGIATVGWVAVSCLAICIPIAAILKGASPIAAGALPLVVILGAGLIAVRVWSSGEKLVNQKENEALKKRLAELEERLGNLEMIDSMEAHFAQKHAQAETAGNATMGPRAATND